MGLYVIHRLTNHLRHHPEHRSDHNYQRRFLHQTCTEALRDAPRLRQALRRHRIAVYSGRRRRRPEPTAPLDG